LSAIRQCRSLGCGAMVAGPADWSRAQSAGPRTVGSATRMMLANGTYGGQGKAVAVTPRRLCYFQCGRHPLRRAVPRIAQQRPAACPRWSRSLRAARPTSGSSAPPHRSQTAPAGLLSEYERPACNRRDLLWAGTINRRQLVPVTWPAAPIQPDQKTKSGIRVAHLTPMKRRFAFCLPPITLGD
jgi:hypothetical protein